jgi:hypothetical protein
MAILEKIKTIIFFDKFFFEKKEIGDGIFPLSTKKLGDFCRFFLKKSVNSNNLAKKLNFFGGKYLILKK